MTIYGWLGGSISVIYNVPQIVHVYRTKNVKGISNISIILRILSYVLVIIHTYQLHDLALLVTTSLGLSQLCIIYLQTCFYKQENKIVLELDDV